MGLSSCLILLGASLIYSFTGLTNLESIYSLISTYSVLPNSILNLGFAQDLSSNIYFFDLEKGPIGNGIGGESLNHFNFQGISLGLILIFVGFLFKISGAPFHNWSPDRKFGKLSLIGNKLPNSGDTLELLIPNHKWKFMSGWSNYSCTVTSQKASEKNVGNRGSKTIFLIRNIVKEQRVNGSWVFFNIKDTLRCTLMVFERKYQVKIPSKLKLKNGFILQNLTTIIIYKHR